MKRRPPLDYEEFGRWWRQSEHTLASAERDRQAGDFAWASFKAHQAAEYAVKALLRGLGRVAVGHSVLRLATNLEELGMPVPEPVREAARAVDRHYIPPRYPDAYPQGSPFEFYDAVAADGAMEAAKRIIAFVEEVLADAPSPKGNSRKAKRAGKPGGQGQGVR